jgi:hypothetical protein
MHTKQERIQDETYNQQIADHESEAEFALSCSKLRTYEEEREEDDYQEYRTVSHGMFSFAALSMQHGQGKAYSTSEQDMVGWGVSVASMRHTEQ